MAGLLKPSAICMRLALILLLISMQGFALAHDLDRNVQHDGSVCVACSAGSHHEAAVQSHHQIAIKLEVSRVVAHGPIPVISTAPIHCPEARAPPLPQ